MIPGPQLRARGPQTHATTSSGIHAPTRALGTIAPYVIILLLSSCAPVGDQMPVIVAHRGASQDAPENTRPAFELAWRQGADAIEGDFHLTRDGHVVCIHDADTDRVAEANLRVVESTLEELRRLDVGAHHGEDYRGTVIPTLSEVLATVPETGKVYLEIKCGPEIIPGLLGAIEASGLKRDQVVVMAFDAELIRELKSTAPWIRTSWLVRIQPGKPGPSLTATLRTLRRIQADGLSSGRHVTEALARGVQRRGYDWHVWTVDDPAEARRFREWGADSIITNVPGVIRQSFDGAEAVAAAVDQ